MNIINEYTIKETIGKGAFSKVKLGINKLTGEKVAIKIIDKKKIKINSENKRIEREINILKKLNHLNIVKIVQIKEDMNNIYIIMEYIENNLFNYILNKKYLSEQESSFYFFQLISGIDFIHSQGIVHRDLKPENILITKNKILKIIDFGLSNYFSKGKLLSTLCGSPSYTAPEIIQGNKYDGFVCDIWAIGIILYTMICGHLPFEEYDNKILFKKIIKCKIEYPKYIPNNIKILLQKILVANPDKRINIKEIKKNQVYLNGKKLFSQKFPELFKQIENKSNLNNEYSSQMKRVGPNFELLKKILKGNKIINKEKQEDYKRSYKDNNNSSKHLLNKLSKEKQTFKNEYLLTDENEKNNNYDSGKIIINIKNYNNKKEKKEIKIECLYKANIKRRNNKNSIMNFHSLNSKENNWSINNYAETNTKTINDYAYNNSEMSIINKQISNKTKYKVNNSYSNRKINNYNKNNTTSYKKRKNRPIIKDKFRNINFPVQKNITKINELYSTLLNNKKEEKNKNLYFKIMKLTKKKKEKGKDIINKSEKKRKRIDNLTIINIKNNNSTKYINRNEYIKIKNGQNNKKKKGDKYNIKEIIKRRGLDLIINKN